MLLKFLLLTILLGFTYSDRCLQCIAKQESGCRRVGCKMDRGSLSCGYYQIKLPYYQECGEPERLPQESSEDAWKRCSNRYHCAANCVENYFKKYKAWCPGKPDCEAKARLHNGGQNGCYSSATDGFWERVRQCVQSNY
uniref:lysozyme n=1 Tax=Strongyloides venezuelensis TaxID=75913 RepID=A0A0K0EW40_STRVS